MQLTNKQLMAVRTTDPNVLVVAAAASGKTRVLTERIKFLLEQGVAEKNIVTFSFTNISAEEIRKRLPNVSNDLFIGTVHSYANQVCKDNGIDNMPQIVLEKYDYIIERANKIRDTKLPKIKHLLIDEFQDISPLEYLFFERLNPENLFCVGDARQNIYTFRGTTKEFFEHFYYTPSFTKYYLLDNYRNPQNIIDFANRFLHEEDHLGPNSISVREDEGIIEEKSFYEVFNTLVYTQRRKDWVVLCRSNREVELIQAMLDEENVPNITFKNKDLTQTELNELMNKDVIKVLTIHSFKGKEAPFVIVVGAKNYNEEERRVCYVAATRAMNILYWCPPLRRQTKKSKNFSKYSQNNFNTTGNKMVNF